MSVVIRGMKMPKDCTECRFAYDGMCLANWGRKSKIDVTNYCPLIELKPHGRLIDADALITTFCEWGTRLERGRKLVITMCEAKQAIVDIIEDATTIIEAEEVSE